MREISRTYKISQIVALMLLSLTLCMGCRGREIIDPPSTFKDLAKQDYDFLRVWEVSLEAMKSLNFQVQSATKDGVKRQGVIISKMRIQPIVRLKGVETAQRLRIEIKALPGSTSHAVTVAASEWTREVTPAEGADLWEFVGTAKDLHDAFESTMEKQFSQPYKGKKN
jgi:hypothetical protein